MATSQESLMLARHYQQQGALQAAEQLYRQILEAEPGHAEALYHLGFNAYRLGRLDVAEHYLSKAAAAQPQVPMIHCHLGLVYRALRRPQEAIACLERAIRLKPDYAEAFNNLGAVLRDVGRLADAIGCYEQAVRCAPYFAGAHSNLSVVYQAAGRLDEALASCREAMRLDPTCMPALINMGATFQAQGKLDDAVATFQQALQINPNFAETYYNLGVALRAQGKWDDGLACLEQALRLNPNAADAHLARSAAWLETCDFQRGWAEYEWRQRSPNFAIRPLPQARPTWDGSPLHGRTILLRAEQGLGDTIQFIRYAAVLAGQGGRVLAEVQPRLIPLLRTCPGIEQLIPQGQAPPPFDVQIFLLSLPRVLGTNLDNVPATVPYLAAEAEWVAKWRQELSGIAGFKIGISWKGNPTKELDQFRSTRLMEFARLAQVNGVHLFSLQKGPGKEELDMVAEQFPITDLGSRLDEATGAFMDTAAVLQSLDLVITVDTALAHLAGALGVPVWVALTVNPDWRWLRDRSDSPWYPTMRLFRQTRVGDWGDVFVRMRDAVRARMGAKG
jgi:tetratricopeptide (TPR) repeat protein